MSESDSLWCSDCKCSKSTDQFVNGDRVMKTCNKCRESAKDRRKSMVYSESENGEQDDEFTGQNYNYKTRYNRYKADDPDFDLSLDEFVLMIVENCHYCKKRNLYKGFNGIDRVDSTQPHIPGNCVACCWNCNRMKGTMDVHDFMRHIKAIYEHLNLQNF